MLQLRSQSHSQVNLSLIPIPAGYLVQSQSIIPLETRSGINHLTRKYTKLLTKKWRKTYRQCFKDWHSHLPWPQYGANLLASFTFCRWQKHEKHHRWRVAHTDIQLDASGNHSLNTVFKVSTDTLSLSRLNPTTAYPGISWQCAS